MKTDELREKFLTFFESKGCVRRPSDVLVPRNDPTVLFTPAGMNQFKEQFLGIGKLEFTRATTCQKCLRTGDIEQVGVTAYHHTFFEMLGNFSFGDYFKREAIQWAWEFLTDKKWLGLDPERLSVSVYEDDDEAYEIWHKEIGLPPEKIERNDEYENFWPAGAPTEGPDGVCGPCSEIFYHPPGEGKPVEIWNLVFTQFNRVGPPPNNLRPLPKKNIDTGMGLERAASVLQGVKSNFEIDILRPLCDAAGEAVGVKYEFDGPQGRPLRRIADHIRAVTFCVHEGVEPGTDKQSYVVRQLLRRAFLEGYLLGKHEPFLFQLVPVVVELMKGPYPELQETTESVANIVREEETQFLDTLERGIQKFERVVAKCRSEGKTVISGDDAFDLHQTDGFLIELTEAMASRYGMSVDRARFDERMEELKQISGSGAFLDAVMVEGPLAALRKKVGTTEFLGYETTEAQGKVVGLIVNQELVEQIDADTDAEWVAVVLDRTPFYAEAGGQVGDTGVLVNEQCEFRVTDTQSDGELRLHIGRLRSGKLQVGDTVQAKVDAERRAGIRRAHSATHLLHYALRKVLGPNATQRGSKVEQDALRFDFTHRGPLSDEQLRQIEEEVLKRISEGAPIQTTIMDLEEAKRSGALALFGEKYPDRVRVVRMGDFSCELCGGTHLTNTGQVGMFKLIGDEPVAKGVRRVTALTGPKALERIRQTEDLLKQLMGLLKTPRPEELTRRVQSLLEEVREARKQLSQAASKTAQTLAEQLIEQGEMVNDVLVVVQAVDDADRETMRGLMDQIRAKVPKAAVLLATVRDGKVALTAAVSKELVKQGVSAAECVRTAAKVAGGGGGGRPDMAEAGGKLPEKLPDALKAGLEYYKTKLAGSA